MNEEQLRADLEACTPGRWVAHRADGLSIYMRHEDGVKGRHIADTGRIGSNIPPHIKHTDHPKADLHL